MVLLLTESDVRSVLTMDIALQAVEEAMRGLADGSAINQPRRRIMMQGGVLHYMASAVRSSRVFGLKAYPTFGGRVDFLIPLYNVETGKLLALIEATGWDGCAPERRAAWRPNTWPAPSRRRWVCSARAGRRAHRCSPCARP